MHMNSWLETLPSILALTFVSTGHCQIYTAAQLLLGLSYLQMVSATEVRSPMLCITVKALAWD